MVVGSVRRVRADVAAELTVEIDRLALCIHQPAGRRPELQAALVPLGLPRNSVVVVAARFLAAGRFSIADLRSMSRYAREEDLEAIMHAHVRRGLLEPADEGSEGLRPSEGFQGGAQVVLELQAEEAERLWGSGPAVAALQRQAQRHVDAAFASPLPLDAFRRQVGVHGALPDGVVAQLLGNITELRYLRSDVHAGCLDEVGLEGPPARTLHRLWRGFPPTEVIDASLVERGLVEKDASGTIITERGAAACARVEEATNLAFAAVFGSLDDAESATFLDDVRALAGADPRPAEDR